MHEAPRPPEKPAPGPVVVYVEDDPVIRAATVRLLRGAGFEVIEAADGRQGRERILAVKPDIALIDVDLGDVDGRALCESLREEPDMQSTFLVLVSGVAVQPDDRAQGLEAGADGYISRPVENRELLARVRAFLRIRDAEQGRRDAERALYEARKLHAVGTLAGGIAHEMNNLLMGVLGYAELCLDDLAPDSPVRGYVDEITSSAHRAAELTRQLLAIGRRQIIRPEAMDLDDAVSDRLRKIHRLVGSVPALTWVAGAGSHTVALDPSQFDQILAELCVNARDAIQAAGRPGEIRVSTAQSVVTAEDGGPGTSVEPGEYVVLSVADNGCGMNAETLEHLFEPFFTTKPVGEGLGLGLATVFGIVRQNGGTVEVDSNPGAGTRVRVLLPRLTAQSSAAAASSFTPPGVSDPHGEHSAGSA